MAEKEQDHRHAVAKAEATHDFRLARGGQVFGIFALLILAAMGAYLGYLGHANWAAAVATVDVAGVVGIFVTGQRTADAKPAATTEVARKDDIIEDPPSAEAGDDSDEWPTESRWDRDVL